MLEAAERRHIELARRRERERGGYTSLEEDPIMREG
jgi:hypothetical protein